MYTKRHIEQIITEDSKYYPAVLVTGPRQVGKSTVLKELYKTYGYETLDDLVTLQSIESDPTGYLKLKGTPIILDEIQKSPTLFGCLKYFIDTNKKNGMYFLTGSQKLELMKGVSESLSGRISIINLLGFSLRELKNDNFNIPFLPTTDFLINRKSKNIEIRDIWEIIHRGSMPALYDNPKMNWEKYYSNYITTYIERDVKNLAQVGDTLAFSQFMVSLASRTGELLNMESIAKEIGISAPTIKRWVSILQASNIIYLLQPFSTNATRRVVKTPKVYFTDTGLVCYLCKWLTTDTLINGAMSGNIFETFVVDEIIKSYYNAGKEPNIYYYRDTDSKEIDLLFYENGTLYPVEIKKTSSPNIKDIKHFKILESCYPTLKIGEGGIICSNEKLLPLGINNKIIPINYI